MLNDRNTLLVEKSATSHADSMPDCHVHDCYEIYLLLTGRRRYFIEHSIYDVAPGNMVIVGKNELHKTTAIGKGRYERYVLYFRESRISSLLDSVQKEAFDAFMQSGCFRLPPDVSREVETKFQQLAAEQEKNDCFVNTAEETILQQILILLFRYGQRKEVAFGSVEKKIQEVVQYISHHYGSEITLRSAAALAYMEPTYFSKQFKKTVGFGFNQYLIQVRMKEAKRLLITTELSIGEIAEKCGYSAGNYFGDTFKLLTGISPSVFRKMHR